MGAKINFCYLTDKINSEILRKTLDVLFELGWRYNQYVQGEYSYWIDAPMSHFGESKTVREPYLNLFDQSNKINIIVEELSKNYSPFIALGNHWFGRNVLSILSIYENDLGWKEVKFSLDRYEALDSLDLVKKDEAIKELSKIFTRISLNIEPYYGIGATEMMGLVESPEELVIDNEILGDFNYFSKEAALGLNPILFEQGYVKNKNRNGSIILEKRHRIMELG